MAVRLPYASGGVSGGGGGDRLRLSRPTEMASEVSGAGGVGGRSEGTSVVRREESVDTVVRPDLSELSRLRRQARPDDDDEGEGEDEDGDSVSDMFGSSDRRPTPMGGVGTGMADGRSSQGRGQGQGPREGIAGTVSGSAPSRRFSLFDEDPNDGGVDGDDAGTSDVGVVLGGEVSRRERVTEDTG